MYTWNWVNNTFSTIIFRRFCLLLCHCQWHYEEKHSEVAIIRHRFQHVAKNVGGILIFFLLSSLTSNQIWLKSSCEWSPTHLHHKFEGKKTHWYPSSAHACVFLFTKKLANFCHLVTPPKKTQISVEKSSSKSPDSEGLFFEIAIFGQWAL
jgi:hypothetical protein